MLKQLNGLRFPKFPTNSQTWFQFFFWILPLNISLEKWGAPQSCNFSLKPTQWFENVWSNGVLNYPCQLINLIHISTVLAGHTEPYHVHMSIKQKLHHTAMWVWYDARSQAQLCPKTIEPALKKIRTNLMDHHWSSSWQLPYIFLNKSTIFGQTQLETKGNIQELTSITHIPSPKNSTCFLVVSTWRTFGKNGIVKNALIDVILHPIQTPNVPRSMF